MKKTIAQSKLRKSDFRHANEAEQMFIADAVYSHKPNQHTTVYLYADMSYLRVTAKKADAMKSNADFYRHTTRNHINYVKYSGEVYQYSKKLDHQGKCAMRVIERPMPQKTVDDVLGELNASFSILESAALGILLFVLTFLIGYVLSSIILGGM